MKIKLNPEYVKRHLFVVAVFFGMAMWFGYDGAVGYPSKTADQLYRDIHAGEAASSLQAAEEYKVKAIHRQFEFAALFLVLSAIVGIRLFKASRLDFEFDETGFSVGGRGSTEAQRYRYDQIVTVDRSRWERKSILSISVNGASSPIILDAWHHNGVVEFEKQIASCCSNSGRNLVK